MRDLIGGGKSFACTKTDGKKCKSCKEVGEEVMGFHSRRQYNCSSTWDFQITTSAAKSQYYCKVFVHLCYFWFRFQIYFFTRPSAILWPQSHHRQMQGRAIESNSTKFTNSVEHNSIHTIARLACHKKLYAISTNETFWNLFNKWQDFKLVTTYPDDVNCQGGVIHWWEANCLGWIAWEKGPGETFSGSDGIWSSKEGVGRDRKWRLVVISLLCF